MSNHNLRLFLIVAGLCSGYAVAWADEVRIYEQSSTGNIQYHKPSAVIQQNGRVIETDQFGNKQHHKQQYQIKDGKVYQTDSVGNIQYHKPKGVMKK